MTGKSASLLVLFAVVLAACGGDGGEGIDTPPDEAVIQITSEGGFVPVEFALSNGPRYTVLGDGSVIFQGVTTLEFPGRLVPSYFVARLDKNQMDALLAMVDDIGLPDIDDETDDSANNMVADASTEVIRFWDDAGEHRLAVYALGIQPESSQRNRAFLELIETLDRFTGQTDAEPYVATDVRIVAGAGIVNSDFEDVRSWPLDQDWGAWTGLDNGWKCRVFGPEALDSFETATQATVWEMPDGGFDFDPANLLVRPLLPGEPNCP